jgi:hypothetical protein
MLLGNGSYPHCRLFPEVRLSNGVVNSTISQTLPTFVLSVDNIWRQPICQERFELL